MNNRSSCSSRATTGTRFSKSPIMKYKPSYRERSVINIRERLKQSFTTSVSYSTNTGTDNGAHTDAHHRLEELNFTEQLLSEEMVQSGAFLKYTEELRPTRESTYIASAFNYHHIEEAEKCNEELSKAKSQRERSEALQRYKEEASVVSRSWDSANQAFSEWSVDQIMSTDDAKPFIEMAKKDMPLDTTDDMDLTSSTPTTRSALSSIQNYTPTGTEKTFWNMIDQNKESCETALKDAGSLSEKHDTLRAHTLFERQCQLNIDRSMSDRGLFLSEDVPTSSNADDETRWAMLKKAGDDYRWNMNRGRSRLNPKQVQRACYAHVADASFLAQSNINDGFAHGTIANPNDSKLVASEYEKESARTDWSKYTSATHDCA